MQTRDPSHIHRIIPDRLIRLGNVFPQGVTRVHAEAKRSILDHGRIALFIGLTGEAVGCSYRHDDYERHCRVHAPMLVGTYEITEHGTLPEGMELALLEDIQHHVAGLPGQAGRAA